MPKTDSTSERKPPTRVLASGVFDILHPGHLRYLSAAKEHGDELVVIITSDGHATTSKRRPRHSEVDRAALVASLAPVDQVIVGHDPYDLVATTREAAPDIIALGHDQPFDPATLQTELAAAGLAVEVVRIEKFGPNTTELFGPRD
jgi:FAD synthetase